MVLASGDKLDERSDRDPHAQASGGDGRLPIASAGVLGTVSGIAPHLFHHIAPIAGAALLGGLTGTIIFGVVGLLLMIPSLIQLRRHLGTLRAPAAALVLFGVLFAISTVWIGPAIRGETTSPNAHSPDHPGHVAPSGSADRR